MSIQSIKALKVILLGTIAAGLSSCGERAKAPESDPSPALPGVSATRDSEDGVSAPWATAEAIGGSREKIKSSSASPGKRLEVARDIIQSMSGRDAKQARMILADMVGHDLLANSETGDDGEIVITITAGDLLVVEQAYQHLARIAPREAALVLPDIPSEVGEELVDRMLAKNPGLDEQALREFQAGLDHDAAASLPWRLAREWAQAYGEDTALGHLEKISGFLPVSPAEMMARMRNSLAAGQ